MAVDSLVRFGHDLLETLNFTPLMSLLTKESLVAAGQLARSDP